MDSDQVERSEMRLEQRHPTWIRLLFMGAAVAFLVWETAELIAKGYPPATGDSSRFLVVILICGLAILSSVFTSNLRWTIRSDEIQIDENWIYDRQRVARIKPGEITKISIATESDEGGERFYIRIWLVSGDDVQSPPLTDGQRANELKAQIAKRLGFANA